MDLSRSQETVLETFSRALRREAHVLTQHPNLLWQQLYNRLQWEGERRELIAWFGAVPVLTKSRP
jgi:hypothetical protein